MKKRLDAVLIERGLFSGRDRAKAIIMSGIVYLNGQKADKPGTQVSDSDLIEVRGDTMPYVSRGGLKLEKAITSFGIELDGAVCCDFGASTGGFTDCMLKNAAARVYAIDVGYGQLAWELRNDPRVINMERTNVRYLTKEEISEDIDFISMDLSFISLTLVLKTACMLLKDGCKALCLVKPQFEAGRENVGKKGVVKDPLIHVQVIEKVVDFCPSIGLSPVGLDFSPVKGPQGNIEYLLLVQKGKTESSMNTEKVKEVVSLSHTQLNGESVV